MSKATKRKHVTKEVMDDYVEPDDNQEIVKVLAGRGNNLHEVENAEGKKFLVSMPSKFRKNVWIKRGDFVIVEPIEEGNKVCAEIVYILYPKQIKYLKEEKLWPVAFIGAEEKKNLEEKENAQTKENRNTDKGNSGLSSGSESEDNDDDLFVNTNRPPTLQYSDTDSDSDSEEEEEIEKTGTLEDDEEEKDKIKNN